MKKGDKNLKDILNEFVYNIEGLMAKNETSKEDFKVVKLLYKKFFGFEYDDEITIGNTDIDFCKTCNKETSHIVVESTVHNMKVKCEICGEEKEL